MIARSGDFWLLKSQDGSKIIGRHPSELAAQAQAQAISAHQHAALSALTACKDCYQVHTDDEEDLSGHHVKPNPEDRIVSNPPDPTWPVWKNYLVSGQPGNAVSLAAQGLILPGDSAQKKQIPGTLQDVIANKESYVKRKAWDSKDVLHVDAAIVLGSKATVLENGYLKAPAFISRTGVFEYGKKDGGVRRELRLPEEVFNADTLASFSMVPVTDGHPPRPLDTTNTKLHQIGYLGEAVKQNGNFVEATVMITDAKAVKAILAGEKVQLSGGYYADVEDVSGEYNGQRYDAIQRNIRGNHVALCPEGRAGSDVRVRLDSDSNCMIQIEGSTGTPSTGVNVIRYTIDDADFEVSEALHAALTREKEKRSLRKDELKTMRKELKTALDTAQAELTKAQARADSAEAELKNTKATVSGPEFAKAVAARVALENVASQLEIKCDGLSDSDVKVAVIEKVRGAKLTRIDSAYVDASFDIAVAAPPSTLSTAGSQVRADAFGSTVLTQDSSEAARKRMLASSTTYAEPGKLSIGANRDTF